MRQTAKMNRLERLHLNAATTQPRKKMTTNRPAPHIIIKKTYNDATASCINQSISHQATHWIIIDNKKLQMDMMTGAAYIIQQIQNKIIAICIETGVIA